MIVVDESQLFREGEKAERDHPATSQIHVSTHSHTVLWRSTDRNDRYELLKWEEHQLNKRGLPLRREMEWNNICREIALMNKPYTRT